VLGLRKDPKLAQVAHAYYLQALAEAQASALAGQEQSLAWTPAHIAARARRPMPIVRQADFTGGEVDPRLWGKTTHAEVAPTFVRTMSNFYAVPQGAAMNRPGTKFIAPAKDQ
jgi:hypothetical protein